MRLLFPYFSLRLQWSVRALWWTMKSCYDRRFHQMFTSFFSVRVVWWVYGDAPLSLARIHYLFSSIAVQLWNFFPYLRLLISILCWTTRELSSNETCYEKTLGIATVFRFSPLITTSILDRPRDLSLIAFHENQSYLSCIGDIRLLWNTYSVENNLLYHRKN